MLSQSIYFLSHLNTKRALIHIYTMMNFNKQLSQNISNLFDNYKAKKRSDFSLDKNR